MSKEVTSDKKKRRGKYGQGTIYERNGRIIGEYNYTSPDGKYRRHRVTGSTKKEVRDKLTEAAAKVKKGIPIWNEQQTLAEFLIDWIQNAPRPNPVTAANYERIVKRHLIPGLGRHRLSTLTPQHVQAFLNRLRESGNLKREGAGLSAGSVGRIRAVLTTALNDAMRWDFVHRNVAALVRAPSEEHKETKPLSPEEAQRFLRAIQGHRLEALYGVAMLGLRQGEILGLHWDDVDLRERFLRVRMALKPLGGRAILGEVKSRRSRRTIPLPAFAVRLLEEHRERQLVERERAGSRWQETGLVFTTAYGTPINRRNLDRQFASLLKRAGLPHFTFHSLRHSCATLLIEQGVHARHVQEILGHSSFDVTMDVYGHVSPTSDALRDAMDRLDRVLAPRLTLVKLESEGDAEAAAE